MKYFDELSSGCIPKEIAGMLKDNIQAGHQNNVDYIAHIGDVFMIDGCGFTATPSVYKPHPWSSSLMLLRTMARHMKPVKTLLELGAGSGVIGLLLAREAYCRSLTLTDINPAAIECARTNISGLSMDLESFQILQSDLFDHHEIQTNQFDVIAFNLPFFHTKQTVGSHEIALSDQEGNLAKRFLSQAGNHLKEGGEIWFTWSNLSDSAVLKEAGDRWIFSLKFADFDPASGIWRFVYQGVPR